MGMVSGLRCVAYVSLFVYSAVARTPLRDIHVFSKLALVNCNSECQFYRSQGCCEKPSCVGCACWSVLCQYSLCCEKFNVSEPIARRMQNLMRAQAMEEVPLPPRLCPPSKGDVSLPDLPHYEGPTESMAPFRSGDIAVVVITSTKSLKSGLSLAAAKTWVRRFPAFSVFFATTQAGTSPFEVFPAELGDVTVLGLPCPSYWKLFGVFRLACDSYNSHMYTGPLAVRHVLLRQPHARWYVVVDDDMFLDPWGLSQQLEGLSSADAMCLGNNYWQGCEGSSCSPNMSLFSYGNGIICSNAAMRTLYRHLESGIVAEPFRRWGPSYGDTMMTKCIDDLRIPKGHLHHYAVLDPDAFLSIVGSSDEPWPISVHRVRSNADFASLDSWLAPLQTAGKRLARGAPDFHSKKIGP